MDFFIQLAPSVIKFPRSTEEKAVVSREFERISGIPDVIGCIDGSYIGCRTPAHKIPSTYINRHDMVSITLQGICDSKRRFLDVFCGSPSKIHDSRIFNLSFISKCLPRICRTKYHLLADSAYPLRQWLITPYKESPDLNETHREFNKCFCATRVIIENTFALLKQRFRQLIRLDFHTVDTMSKSVLSCCVLHNLCIDNDDNWEENFERETETTRFEDVSSTVTISGAQHLRNKGEIK